MQSWCLSPRGPGRSESSDWLKVILVSLVDSFVFNLIMKRILTCRWWLNWSALTDISKVAAEADQYMVQYLFCGVLRMKSCSVTWATRWTLQRRPAGTYWTRWGGQEGENKHTQSADTTVWLTPPRPAPETRAQEENEWFHLFHLLCQNQRNLNEHVFYNVSEFSSKLWIQHAVLKVIPDEMTFLTWRSDSPVGRTHL